MTPDILLTDAPDPSAREAITRGLVAFNRMRAGPSEFRPLAVLIRESGTGKVAGGLWGATGLGWLHVELLFVPEALRGARVGQDLMHRAEVEARRRGCRGAWLDTFSFQAWGFYERLGYAVCGTIEDHPPGHSRFFLKKILA